MGGRSPDPEGQGPVRPHHARKEAAIAKHPGWRPGHASPGVNPTKIDDPAPGFPEILDWFRNSFPDEAREIEARAIAEHDENRRQADLEADRLGI